MRHTLGVLVENQPGVLSRVAGLFSGRGFNIESLTVAETLDKGVSHITLVTTGDEMIMKQIVKQLNKLINVIKYCLTLFLSVCFLHVFRCKVTAEPRMNLRRWKNGISNQLLQQSHD